MLLVITEVKDTLHEMLEEHIRMSDYQHVYETILAYKRKYNYVLETTCLGCRTIKNKIQKGVRLSGREMLVAKCRIF